tara:strand:+ start:366 stop:473 length:108 start_codon:yes stop_codon:yes gene_type:complete
MNFIYHKSLNNHYLEQNNYDAGLVLEISADSRIAQ